MKLKMIATFVLVILCTFISACGSSNIDHDLSTTGFQFRYEVVTNMKENPKNYKNKTIKIKGDLRSNGSAYYYLTETDNVCCTWKLEVQLGNDEMVFPTENKDGIIVVGEFSTYTKNDVEKPYLKITEFV